MRHVRFSLIVAVATAVTVLAGCSENGGGPTEIQGGAEAACAAPEVAVTPNPVVVGEAATLDATNLEATCNDQGEGPAAPAADVTVSLEAVDGSWGPSDVAMLDAAEDFTASATFLLPSDTVPGWVNVMLDGIQYATFEVVAP
ncbi:hypothetical protein [Demequina aurantiaca]|uniref:hypothetical protein n=1 Tax=Demequina aurantiaca TaxID=676200 RepID=UPI000785A925|nr:hypothetical protein [Demequina aurantiaca]